MFIFFFISIMMQFCSSSLPPQYHHDHHQYSSLIMSLVIILNMLVVSCCDCYRYSTSEPSSFHNTHTTLPLASRLKEGLCRDLIATQDDEVTQVRPGLAIFCQRSVLRGQQFASGSTCIIMYKDVYGRREAASKFTTSNVSQWHVNVTWSAASRLPHILPLHLLRFKRRSAARLERRFARRNSNSSRNLKALEG